MGTLDGPMGKVAASVTKSLGGSGTYIRPAAGGEYSTAFLDVTGAGDPRETSVSVAPGGQAELRMFPESSIQEGDEVVIVPRTELSFTPAPGDDKLTWKGHTWQVEEVRPITSGDDAAAYVLLLRK